MPRSGRLFLPRFALLLRRGLCGFRSPRGAPHLRVGLWLRGRRIYALRGGCRCGCGGRCGCGCRRCRRRRRRRFLSAERRMNRRVGDRWCRCHRLAKLGPSFAIPLRWSLMRNGVGSGTIRRVVMGMRRIVRHMLGGRM